MDAPLPSFSLAWTLLLYMTFLLWFLKYTTAYLDDIEACADPSADRLSSQTAPDCQKLRTPLHLLQNEPKAKSCEAHSSQHTGAGCSFHCHLAVEFRIHEYTICRRPKSHIAVSGV